MVGAEPEGRSIWEFILWIAIILIIVGSIYLASTAPINPSIIDQYAKTPSPLSDLGEPETVSTATLEDALRFIGSRTPSEVTLADLALIKRAWRIHKPTGVSIPAPNPTPFRTEDTLYFADIVLDPRPSYQRSAQAHQVVLEAGSIVTVTRIKIILGEVLVELTTPRGTLNIYIVTLASLM